MYLRKFDDSVRFPGMAGVPNGRPTLAAVAAAAGTSVPTVSKVLRGGTDVSNVTRARVFEAVSAVGYSRHPARSAGVDAWPDRPPLVDLVMNHVNGTWANGVLTGVEEVAASARIDVVITLARNDGDWVTRLLRRPSYGAIVVLVDPSASQFAALDAANIPVVLVDPMSRPAFDAPAVGVTNWDGGRAAAEHLLELGHRKVAIIGGGRTHLYGKARIDGFRSAFEDAGLAVPTQIAYADWDRDQARTVAGTILDLPDRPTAIFACSDLMAVGVFDAAKQRGLAIPHDLSVVGFDDVPEAQWASPSITTIRQPIGDMGKAAVRLLLDVRARSRSAPTGYHRIDLATKIVVRESTAAARPSD